jgi:hypothetical protein
MNDSQLLMVVAGAISTSYREEAKRNGTWKNAPLDEPSELMLTKVRQRDPECHAQIMREASAILAALEEVGALRER